MSVDLSRPICQDLGEVREDVLLNRKGRAKKDVGQSLPNHWATTPRHRIVTPTPIAWALYSIPRCLNCR